MTKKELIQFSRFMLVGGTSALVSLAVRALASKFIMFEFAVVLAQVLGALVAFTLNLLFVFNSFKGNRSHSLGRFMLVNVASLIIATCVSSALFRLLLESAEGPILGGYIAHFVGLGAASVPSYLAHKYFSFAQGSAGAKPGLS